MCLFYVTFFPFFTIYCQKCRNRHPLRMCFNFFYDFFCRLFTKAMRYPNTRNPPGARMKRSMPSAMKRFTAAPA